MDKKAMLGPKVRRLRRERGLTQAQMADQLGISASYLNLIEHNQRPVTVPLLLKLGQNFGVDLQAFAEDEESRLVAGLREVFADTLFDGSDIKNQDLKELAAVAPTLGQAVVTLYRAFREQREDLQNLGERLADRDKLNLVHNAQFPLEEVRDFFHAHHNHFPEIEAVAEALWAEANPERGDLYRGLVDWLLKEQGVRVKIMPADVMGYAVRRFDRHGRRILVSEMLAPSGRNFQLAAQIALLRHRELINGIVDAANLSGDEARRLARIGLTNYFAGAVLMPYDRFLEGAKRERYDIDVLRRRFDASFEQVCHRLTTLQRPGARGVPFFLIRVDSAGNVSKRFSGAGFHFARFGGGCPRWIVYEAFRTPGKIHTQLAQMPDGTAYFSIARTAVKAGGGYRSPPQQFAMALGCDVAHAGQIVYADGIDLEHTEAATPIGVNCRLCPRSDCSQRAFPPLNHRLIVDENLRGVTPFLFAPPPGER
ncbi:helix-turn-helix domain-containing protein [Azospirillum sp.]|uniref:helix-turn-helix domain-containing protein n=1 Tax=Azospirillum sp. TaxID=34012 RepID=UPI003D732DCD